MEGYSTVKPGPTHCSETWTNILKNLWYHTKTTKLLLLLLLLITFMGQGVAQLMEALRYKPEGRGFDSRW